jgi:hypothetical protein
VAFSGTDWLYRGLALACARKSPATGVSVANLRKEVAELRYWLNDALK